jgi:hypothetical protein
MAEIDYKLMITIRAIRRDTMVTTRRFPQTPFSANSSFRKSKGSIFFVGRVARIPS